MFSNSYQETALEIKSVPDHIEQLKRLASEIDEPAWGSLGMAIDTCAVDETDIGYVEASAILDERFRPYPGAVATAGVMHGTAAASFLTDYLFGEPSSVFWPVAQHAVRGLLLNPNWSADVAPSFDSVIDTDWPLHGKVAVVYLLCQKGAYEVEQACAWLDTTGEEAAIDPHPGALERYVSELRRLCDMP